MGTIWFFFQENFSGSIIGESSQHVSVRLSHDHIPGSRVIVSFVHAWCTAVERNELWADLLRDNPGPRLGSSAAILIYGRARIWKRLDLVLVNEGCYDAGISLSISHLAREPSDHAPLLISVSTRVDNKLRPFRFLNVWADRTDFLGLVSESWDQPCFGSPIHTLCQKLKRLRGVIRLWNKEVVGDIFQAVKRKEEEVRLAEIHVESDESKKARANLHRAQAQLRSTLQVEELFWKQKARVKWLDEGDRNTKFFHSVIKQRRVQSIIHKIKNDRGEWVTSEKAIGEEKVRFFEQLFTDQHSASTSDLLLIIPKLLTDEDNDALE
ncbi:uncharacterized protein [Coffea arabica]|uniref:Uncharacterized protein n=1 Tax=Coffea arabica TaxID=13443 RepID=A0A6P6U0D6_COFAR|nr:uncharacterized protein LOC113705807 [Coffea arabica]